MKPGAKKALTWGVKLAVMAGLLAFLYSRVDLGKFREALGDFRWGWLPVVYALLFANTLLNSWKWSLLLEADGVKIPLRGLVCSHLIGTFFNLFLPSSIGGDAYRVVDVGRRGGSGAKSFAAVFGERLAGFLALAVWGLAFSAVGWRHLTDKRILWCPVAVFALMGAMVALVVQQRLLLAMWEGLGGRRLTKLDAFLRNFLASIAHYREQPAVVARVFGLSMVFQMIAITTIWSISKLLGWTVPFSLFCIFVPLITLGEALPISIFGIGVRDGLYVLFFTGGAGVPREESLVLAAVYVAISVAYSLVGGVVFLLRPGAGKGDGGQASDAAGLAGTEERA